MNTKQLTINGQKYTAQFGLGASYLFCKKAEIEMYEFDERFFGLDPKKLTTQYFEDLALLIIAAIENGHRKTGEPVDLQLVDVINWMAEQPEEYVEVSKLLYGDFEQDAGGTEGNPQRPPRKTRVGKKPKK